MDEIAISIQEMLWTAFGVPVPQEFRFRTPISHPIQPPTLDYFLLVVLTTMVLFTITPAIQYIEHVCLRIGSGTQMNGYHAVGLALFSVPSGNYIGNFDGFNDAHARGLIMAINRISPNIDLSIDFIKKLKKSLDRTRSFVPLRLLPTFLREVKVVNGGGSMTDEEIDVAVRSLLRDIAKHKSNETQGLLADATQIARNAIISSMIPNIMDEISQIFDRSIQYFIDNHPYAQDDEMIAVRDEVVIEYRSELNSWLEELGMIH